MSEEGEAAASVGELEGDKVERATCCDWKVRLALLLLVGAAGAVVPLAASLYNRELERFNKCEEAGGYRSFECSPRAVQALIQAAIVFPIVLLVLGIDCNCCCSGGWCPCNDSCASDVPARCPGSALALLFLLGQVVSALVFVYKYIIWVNWGDYIVVPTKDPLNKGRCICTDDGEQSARTQDVTVWAAIVVVLTLSGAGHLVAARWARKRWTKGIPLNEQS